MATHAPITGAPTRAPSNVLPFPADPVARLRLRLRTLRNERMCVDWLGDFAKLRPSLNQAERTELLCRLALRQSELSRVGVR